jgi:hypothetical protein
MKYLFDTFSFRFKTLVIAAFEFLKLETSEALLL